MGAISSQPRPISKRPTTVQVVPISNSQNKTNQQTFTVNKTCCNEENEDISYLLTILHDSFTKASDFKFHLFKDNTNGLTTIFERYLEESDAWKVFCSHYHDNKLGANRGWNEKTRSILLSFIDDLQSPLINMIETTITLRSGRSQEKSDGVISFVALFILSLLPSFFQSKMFADELAKCPIDTMSLVTDSATWMTTSHGNDNDDLGNRKTTSLRGIYDSKGFLDALFRVFDTLPFSLAMAKVNESGQGFPLIYVNQIFESMTGYSKSEVLGKGAAFLQKHKDSPHPMHNHSIPSTHVFTERTSVDKMKQAFRKKENVKVCITDFKKTGEPFVNLLALKLIFDQHGVFRFIVAILFDVTASDLDSSMLHGLNFLYQYIPSVIYLTE